MAVSRDMMRACEPRSSSISSDFIPLKDLRDMALAEVEICPDNAGWVAVGRIKQIDRLLGQRVLR
jgi:hypothetical protein